MSEENEKQLGEMLDANEKQLIEKALGYAESWMATGAMDDRLVDETKLCRAADTVASEAFLLALGYELQTPPPEILDRISPLVAKRMADLGADPERLKGIRGMLDEEEAAVRRRAARR